jgi:hypothetical protein
VRARKMGKQPHIEVVPHLTSEPSLESRVLIREWLKLAVWWVQWLLYEFSEPPEALSEVGLDLDVLEAVYTWDRPLIN